MNLTRRFLATVTAAILVAGLAPAPVVGANPTASAEPVVVEEDGGPKTVTLTATDPDGGSIVGFPDLEGPDQRRSGNPEHPGLQRTRRRLHRDGRLHTRRRREWRRLVRVPRDRRRLRKRHRHRQRSAITAVNDAPSFTKGADQSVAEDAGAQTVPDWATGTPGPANESGQALAYVIDSITNASLFSVQPAVSPTGTLTYTPAANANGSSTVTLHLTDNGGGTNASPTQQFTITVTSVNDAPTFTKGADQSVVEDAGAQSVAGWATSISPGPADESGQTVSFSVTNSNNALFSVQPAVSPTGTLTYTPAANANGVADVEVSLSDSGGTLDGGADTSPTQTFTITIASDNVDPTAVIDTPTVLEDSGTTTIDVLANDSTAPDTGEILTVTGVTEAAKGTAMVGPLGASVTYTPDQDANGTDTFTYTISDGNGGTATGTVSVSITAVNDAPSFTKGADQSVVEDAGAQHGHRLGDRDQPRTRRRGRPDPRRSTCRPTTPRCSASSRPSLPRARSPTPRRPTPTAPPR